MSIFTKIIHGIGVAADAVGHFLGHLFAADILPFAIEITQEINEAVKSGDAQTLVNILSGIFPGAGHIAQDVLDEAKVLGPKVLATELGLQTLEAGANAEDVVAWANGVIQSYGSADLLTKSKVWNALATKLAALYDNGRQTNKTWMQWAVTVEEAFQAIQQAAASQDEQGAAGTN